MRSKLATFLFLSLAPIHALQAADMAGSSDHPSLPRVAGSEILGYAYSDYDTGNFLTVDSADKVGVENHEGKRTRLLYLLESGDTPLKVQKNYEVALAELGDVVERYSCAGKRCSNQIISTTLWSRDTMIPTERLKHPFYLLGFAHNYTLPTYRYTQITAGQIRYHVGLLAAKVAPNNSNKDMHGRTVALLEILEIADFAPTLEFVDAAEMQSEIAAAGHVALYGIQFDHDKATLRAESEATLAEIATVLKQNETLTLYVVGHTDDVGALEYNQDLSLRRAKSVRDALVARGIGRDRLTPLGAGPLAPVGSNDTEDGRARNRRVELVKRHTGR